MKNNVVLNALVIGSEKAFQFLLIYLCSIYYNEYDFSIYIKYISILLVFTIFGSLGSGVFLKELYANIREDYHNYTWSIIKLLLISNSLILVFVLLSGYFDFFEFNFLFYIALIFHSALSIYASTFNVINILTPNIIKRAVYLILVPLTSCLYLLIFRGGVEKLIVFQIVVLIFVVLYVSPKVNINGYSKVKFLSVLKYLPHSLSMYIIINSDRLMVSFLSTKYELIKYTLATQFTNLLNLIIVLAEIVLLRMILSQEKDVRSKIRSFKIVALPIFIVLAYMIDFIFGVIYPAYVSTVTEIIFLNSISMYFMLLYMLNVNARISENNGGKVIVFSVSFACLNLLLNYIFIPTYGAIAASSTTLLVYFLMALFTTRLNKNS